MNRITSLTFLAHNFSGGNYSGEGPIPWWGWLIIALCIIIPLLILFFCYLWRKYREIQEEQDQDYSGAYRDEQVTCYLCQRRVPSEKWESGAHREVCARVNRSSLRNMRWAERQGCPVHCPKCDEQMRLWPPRLGREFTCDGKSCPMAYGAPIRSDSADRYNCFECDYDLCRACAKEVVRAYREQHRDEMLVGSPTFRDYDHEYNTRGGGAERGLLPSEHVSGGQAVVTTRESDMKHWNVQVEAKREENYQRSVSNYASPALSPTFNPQDRVIPSLPRNASRVDQFNFYNPRQYQA